jgi:hypothetical protein
LEDAGVDFDLFDAGAVEGAEGAEDAGLFAGAGGAVEEEVGEVGGCGLGVLEPMWISGGKHTSDESRLESSGWYVSVSRERGRSLSTRSAMLSGA